ncbi:uncharacterized protein BJ212DRAFT_158094 [Suillus subaureus]|uniref:Uncharacterized protein n=1 Tax=Suillus subaureus TaxID=48587 RepID=A0A9P7ECD3_9AGAM|nr:uncharacterized protein BJ212DRAFT_158094 [Suillus subaureus]KAG1817230.1 hypothetical protein BJ212DRAFT_158094 [Suillus subaureus]
MALRWLPSFAALFHPHTFTILFYLTLCLRHYCRLRFWSAACVVSLSPLYLMPSALYIYPTALPCILANFYLCLTVPLTLSSSFLTPNQHSYLLVRDALGEDALARSRSVG